MALVADKHKSARLTSREFESRKKVNCGDRGKTINLGTQWGMREVALSYLHFLFTEINWFEWRRGYTKKRLSWPLNEPVDGTAVDKWWEHSTASTKSAADWTHTQHNVKVTPERQREYTFAFLHWVLIDNCADVNYAPFPASERVVELSAVYVWHMAMLTDLIHVLHILLVCV